MSEQYHNANGEKVSSLEELDLSLTYSYANYLNWVFGNRVELIRGKIFKMSPAPSRLHQKVSVTLSSSLFNFLKGYTCEVYTAPFDVRFPKENSDDGNIYTVLQPDICVICDRAKLDERGCLGAPDIVIEILSAGNNKTELIHKYEVYEEFGVKEYWVINPTDKTLLKYNLSDQGKFISSGLFTSDEEATSAVLPGFVLHLSELFED